MRLIIAAASVLFLTLFAVPAGAQTGSGVTQSGSVIETGTGDTLSGALQYLREKLSDRPVEKETQLAQSEAKRKAAQTDIERTIERLAGFRIECREALRKANRDALLSKALQCVRADLLQQLSMQRKERLLLDPPLFYTETVRAEAIKAIEELMEAEQAIIEGIDAEVFVSIEDLEESKRKLLETYRRVYFLSNAHVRADRSLTFMSFISKQLSLVSASVDSFPEALKEVHAGVLCLDTARSLLAASMTSVDVTTAEEWLREGQNRLSQCRENLRKAIRLQRNFETDKAAENSGEQLP